MSEVSRPWENKRMGGGGGNKRNVMDRETMVEAGKEVQRKNRAGRKRLVFMPRFVGVLSWFQDQRMFGFSPKTPVAAD